GTETIPQNSTVTLDCTSGEVGYVYEGKIPFTVEKIEFTKLGTPPVDLLMNIGNPDEAFNLAKLPNNGVGLARLEFIINNSIQVHPMALIHPEQVTDKDGAIMARRIAKEEGLFCGYSAGSCLQGLIQLKDQLKKEDVVVCIFHDHGSRYVGKIYNDQWMMERGFMEVKTFRDIISARGSKQKLITVQSNQTVAEAVTLMQKYEIEHIPVMEQDEVVGAISENGLFQKIFKDPEIKNSSIRLVIEKPYPLVEFNTPLEKISSLINKDNGAVLSKDEGGNYHIITKYDILQPCTEYLNCILQRQKMI
ncbi:MAG: CBS domain-containing protein, partial [Chitinophagia bacterium]|nr:CBS domain-containing protein [Chitinophagia bacterium]